MNEYVHEHVAQVVNVVGLRRVANPAARACTTHGWRARLAVLMLFAAVSKAGIVEDVRASLDKGDLAKAAASVQNYRRTAGVTPETLEAMSWMARAVRIAQTQ